MHALNCIFTFLWNAKTSRVIAPSLDSFYEKSATWNDSAQTPVDACHWCTEYLMELLKTTAMCILAIVFSPFHEMRRLLEGTVTFSTWSQQLWLTRLTLPSMLVVNVVNTSWGLLKDTAISACVQLSFHLSIYQHQLVHLGESPMLRGTEDAKITIPLCSACMHVRV